jgi:hypothetical protein
VVHKVKDFPAVVVCDMMAEHTFTVVVGAAVLAVLVYL